MRIKKLELVGFKSFKDRTVIQFDAGITGVVGPNGCGKSNIVDALMWVMGEMSAKHLRGSSMEDVIFAGSDGHAPVGMAEVSLTLENDGGPFPAKYLNHSEIMVTRRLHRSGESGYFINKEPGRLKDVQEIFMDTGAGSKGFSIVAQGMISQIITQKPEERRNLIEEAAGITKFKARKRESERKLVATEQNLVRLNDIVVELKRQIDSLQRQAQRAERYRNLKQQIEKLDLWLSSNEYLKIIEKVDQIDKDLEGFLNQESDSDVRTAEVDAQVEELRTELAALETLLQSKQTTLAEMNASSRELDINIRELRFEIDQAHKNEERTGDLLQEFRARAELQAIELNDAKEKLDNLEKETATAEVEFNEKSTSFSDVQTQIENSEELLTQNRREMLTISQSESATKSQIEVLRQQKTDLEEKSKAENEVLEEVATKRSEFEKRCQRMRNEVETNKQLHLDITNDVEAQEIERQGLVEKVAEKRKSVDELSYELGQITSKLEGLEALHSNYEGFNEGVKKVINWHKQAYSETHADGSESSYFQPIAEVVDIPAEYELAMEASMGNRMQVLLTEQSNQSLDAVDFLKNEGGGRSSFLSADAAGHGVVADSPSGEGLVAVLRDQVKVPEQFENSAKALFDKIAVVDSVRSALKFRAENSEWTYVTKDGDVLSPDGVLSGGSAESADSGILKRKRDIKELVDKKAECAGKLALTKVSLEKLESQLEHLTRNWEDAQKKNLEQEIKLAEIRKDLERAETEHENAQRAFDQQRSRVDELNLKDQQLAERISELTSAVEELIERKNAVEGIITSLDAEIEEKKNGIEHHQNEVTELKVHLATLKQGLEDKTRQYELIDSSYQETSRQIVRMEQESEEQTSSLSENQISIEEKKIELERMMGEIESLEIELGGHKNKFETQSALLREVESERHELMKSKNEWQTKINDLRLKSDQEKMRIDYLCEQMNERYQVSLSENAAQFSEGDYETGPAKKELSDLKQKLNRIGEVNLSAIEEYDETQERYEYLKKQQEDLINAKEQLGRVIDRINRICTHRFKSTYEMVNERFKKVFPVLFGGGEAELVLVEQEGKEDGIDIIAKPPGKKMQNVTLMSGGEKALTAVSLIFSIFLVKPSPYCLLDEVDAPLDDANVARFNELVHEMAKRSQIILVTHNKYTMEITKKLYGVTMQEKGVSKMVSVSLEDAHKVVEG